MSQFGQLVQELYQNLMTYLRPSVLLKVANWVAQSVSCNIALGISWAELITASVRPCPCLCLPKTSNAAKTQPTRLAIFNPVWTFPFQAAGGLTRLTAMLTTGGGIAALVATNNETNNITDSNERFINAVAPDWGKASTRFHLQPFQLEDVSIEAQLIRKGVDPKLAKTVQQKGFSK